MASSEREDSARIVEERNRNTRGCPTA